MASESSDTEFYEGFESLGANCEFGLLQRHFGAEPLGLLRWPAIKVDGLVDSLLNRFSELDDISKMYLIPGPKGDWDIHTPNFSLHLYVKMGSTDEQELVKTAYRRIQFLRRCLLELLDDAEKIFVFKEWQFRMMDRDIEAMYRAIKTYNASNTLLAVRLSSDVNPPGSVSQIEPGLWSGYVEWDAPVSAADNVPVESWDRMCRIVRANI